MPGSDGKDGFNRSTSIELIDLTSKKVILSGPAPPNTTSVLLSPAGSAVATIIKNEMEFDKPSQIDIWKITGKNISHWVSFQPYAERGYPR